MSDGNGGTAVTRHPDPHSPEWYGEMRAAADLPVEQYPDRYLGTIIRMAVPAEASFSQAAAFLGVCRRYDLNPVLKEAWLALTDDGPQVITSRDVFERKAREQPTYRGQQQGIVMPGESCVIWRDPDDPQVVKVDHRMELGGDPGEGKPHAAYCIVYDEVRPPFVAVRYLKDYEHLLGKKNWRKNPKDMLAARVSKIAHKAMYDLMQGTYTADELDDFAGATDASSSLDAGRAAMSQADDLKRRMAAAKSRNGMAVIDVWHPDNVVEEGKYGGKGLTYRMVAEDEEGWKYLRQVATRGWLGLSKPDRDALHEFLDETAPTTPESDEDSEGGGEDAPEPPEDAEAPSRPHIDVLKERAYGHLRILADRGEDIHELKEEADLLHNDVNLVGLKDLVGQLRRMVEGGAA